MQAVLILVVFFGLFIAGTDSQCTNNAVRLVWGDGDWEGNVQICVNGVWGWVCDNNFGTNDAKVVCNQLGFNTNGALYRMWSYYGWGNVSTPLYLDGVDCAGNEAKLIDCPRAYAAGIAFCGYNEIAGVVCQSGGQCTGNSLRKIRSNSGTPHRGYGRIEMCYNGQWGKVCDDLWGGADAKVACYQLGYTRSRAYSYGNSNFGAGYGQFVYDNARCTGNENTLVSCPSNALGSHNCGNSEAAGLACFGGMPQSCTNGDVKLWRPNGGRGPEYFGLALFCKNSKWTGVCDDSFTCNTARLFCQQLGYPGAFNIRGEGYWGNFYSTNGNNGVDHRAWSCSSSHSSLSQCSYYYHSSCNAYHDQLGIICYPNDQRSECTSGDIRLVNGSDSGSGRVEYCFEGGWSPLCWISSVVATAICQTVGHNTSYATVYNDERYGVSNVLSNLNYLNCPSGATSVSQCSPVRKSWSGGCYLSINRCGTEYGIQCYNNTGTCVDGSARLVNGSIQQEGRIEVCSNGIWSMVCQSNWNAIDAFILCGQLGYTGTGPWSFWNARFGIGNGPAIWANLQCFGWETSLFDCQKSVYPSGSCSVTRTIGVICKDGCTWGQVRLVGGGFDNEGTVQVCYNQFWGFVSDTDWDDNDAKVVCRQLGYTTGTAMAVLGSQYGKPNMTVHLRNVACTGTENNINSCTKTRLSLANGKTAMSASEAAGVDCIYDVPTDPPCVPRPAQYNTPGGQCTNYQTRLTNGQVSGTGRLEFCFNGYWSPFCKMDPLVAQVACREQGYTNYTWGTIVESGEFGKALNFSLFDSITCTGSEARVGDCSITQNAACTPNCPSSNLGLRCYNPGVCTEGAVRLVDGIIENEGRVEVCVNGVWGSVCDQGWDSTDAHIVCKQLGHPDLEPYIFNNSLFGPGQYPIVYTNMSCVGYENRLYDCNKQVYPMSACSQSNVAGALCGYACNNGDVRLVGSQFAYEGTVEYCFDNLWGLISDSSWTQKDAEVVCQQLGYEAQGTISYTGSQYGRPNKTIHLTNVDCNGDESSLLDCTSTSLSLQQGKNMLATTAVAGVKCYTPDQCITPPTTAGTECNVGDIRLVGSQQNVPEGTLQYCYKGMWSPFCYLGPTEATVACRQLGYSDYDLTSVFYDGRFTNMTATSLFQNISCPNTLGFTRLSDCQLFDVCQTTCNYPAGLRCYEATNCMEGDVRLAGGTFSSEGRVEVCTNGIWGTICGSGFTAIDAHVVCKELGIGTAEPTVYTNSFFGDGDTTIAISNVTCKGYEPTVLDCDKSSYGSFTCTRDNVVGIVCRENCQDGDVRLSGGQSSAMGTVQYCYSGTWGLVADGSWSNTNAQVVCMQLGYSRGGKAVLGSIYGKPNRTITLSEVGCTGTEQTLFDCPASVLNPEDGRTLYPRVNVAGVECTEDTAATSASVIPQNSALIGVGIVVVLLILSVLIIVSLILYVVIMRQQVLKANAVLNEPRVKMSGLGEGGIENPMSGLDDEEGGEFDTADKDELVKRLGNM